MNFLNPLSRTRFSNGVAKVRFIFKSPNFFAKIFEISFFKRQSHKELPASTATRFSFGTAKVRFFPLPPNLFSAGKGTEGQKMTAPEEQHAHIQCRTPVVTILLKVPHCIQNDKIPVRMTKSSLLYQQGQLNEPTFLLYLHVCIYYIGIIRTKHIIT